MPTRIKKSSDGEMIVIGPTDIHVDIAVDKITGNKERLTRIFEKDEVISRGFTIDLRDRIAPVAADLFAGRDDGEPKHMLIVTDKEQKEAKRVFSGTIERSDGHEYLLIGRTLNLDKKANPSQSVEILDKPIKIELNQGGLKQVDADRLQALIKSGELVRAMPPRKPEMDALLASGPSGQAKYEKGSPRTPPVATSENKGLIV